MNQKEAKRLICHWAAWIIWEHCDQLPREWLKLSGDDQHRLNKARCFLEQELARRGAGCQMTEPPNSASRTFCKTSPPALTERPAEELPRHPLSAWTLRKVGK